VVDIPLPCIPGSKLCPTVLRENFPNAKHIQGKKPNRKIVSRKTDAMGKCLLEINHEISHISQAQIWTQKMLAIEHHFQQ